MNNYVAVTVDVNDGWHLIEMIALNKNIVKYSLKSQGHAVRKILDINTYYDNNLKTIEDVLNFGGGV